MFSYIILICLSFSKLTENGQKRQNTNRTQCILSFFLFVWAFWLFHEKFQLCRRSAGLLTGWLAPASSGCFSPQVAGSGWLWLLPARLSWLAARQRKRWNIICVWTSVNVCVNVCECVWMCDLTPHHITTQHITAHHTTPYHNVIMYYIMILLQHYITILR